MTGTFDNWSKSVKLEDRGGYFVKDVTLPSAASTIYYKFVVDGDWCYEQSLPNQYDGMGGHNNILTPDKISIVPAKTAQTSAGSNGFISGQPATAAAALGATALGTSALAGPHSSSSTAHSRETTGTSSSSNTSQPIQATSSGGTAQGSSAVSGAADRDLSSIQGVAEPSAANVAYNSSEWRSAHNTSGPSSSGKIQATPSGSTATGSDAVSGSADRDLDAIRSAAQPKSSNVGADYASYTSLSGNSTDNTSNKTDESVVDAGRADANSAAFTAGQYIGSAANTTSQYANSAADAVSANAPDSQTVRSYANQALTAGGSAFAGLAALGASAVGAGATAVSRAPRTNQEVEHMPGAFPETPMGETSRAPHTSREAEHMPGAFPETPMETPAVSGRSTSFFGSSSNNNSSTTRSATESSRTPASTNETSSRTARSGDEFSLGRDPEEVEQSFRVNPLPATGGAGNPLSLRPGEPVPSPSSYTSNTIHSNVRTDKDSYERADSGVTSSDLGSSSSTFSGGAFGVPPVSRSTIPESSMPTESSYDGSHDVTDPTIRSSAGKYTSSSELAGQVPLEPRGLPSVVSDSQYRAHAAPEASASRSAVSDKKDMEDELLSAVRPAPATAESSSRSAVSAPDGASTSGVPDIVRESQQRAHAAPEASASRSAVADKTEMEDELTSAVPEAPANTNSYTGGPTSTTSTVPDIVSDSQHRAHASPEASASRVAVEEKSEMEQELTSKLRQAPVTSESSTSRAESGITAGRYNPGSSSTVASGSSVQRDHGTPDASTNYGATSSTVDYSSARPTTRASSYGRSGTSSSHADSHVPEVVADSYSQAHADPEASALPTAVEGKSEVEQQLLGEVKQTPATSESGMFGASERGVTGGFSDAAGSAVSSGSAAISSAASYASGLPSSISSYISSMNTSRGAQSGTSQHGSATGNSYSSSNYSVPSQGRYEEGRYGAGSSALYSSSSNYSAPSQGRYTAEASSGASYASTRPSTNNYSAASQDRHDDQTASSELLPSARTGLGDSEYETHANYPDSEGYRSQYGTGASSSGLSSSTTRGGTTTSIPEAVSDSLARSHQSPEAAANPDAVREKSAMERELLSEVRPTNETGEPAPSQTSALSSTAPTSTSSTKDATTSSGMTAGGLASYIPGTQAYSETHPSSSSGAGTSTGSTGGLASYIPGTQAYSEAHESSGTSTSGAGLASYIPGTQAHSDTHPASSTGTGANLSNAGGLASYIPGTQAYTDAHSARTTGTDSVNNSSNQDSGHQSATSRTGAGYDDSEYSTHANYPESEGYKRQYGSGNGSTTMGSTASSGLKADASKPSSSSKGADFNNSTAFSGPGARDVSTASSSTAVSGSADRDLSTIAGTSKPSSSNVGADYDSYKSLSGTASGAQDDSTARTSGVRDTSGASSSAETTGGLASYVPGTAAYAETHSTAASGSSTSRDATNTGTTDATSSSGAGGLASYIPGTAAYAETHPTSTTGSSIAARDSSDASATGASSSTAGGLLSYVPGTTAYAETHPPSATESSTARDATSSHDTSTNTGTAGGLLSYIPGTEAYAETHASSSNTTSGQGLASYVPGTQAYSEAHAPGTASSTYNNASSMESADSSKKTRRAGQGGNYVVPSLGTSMPAAGSSRYDDASSYDPYSTAGTTSAVGSSHQLGGAVSDLEATRAATSSSATRDTVSDLQATRAATGGGTAGTDSYGSSAYGDDRTSERASGTTKALANTEAPYASAPAETGSAMQGASSGAESSYQGSTAPKSSAAISSYGSERASGTATATANSEALYASAPANTSSASNLTKSGNAMDPHAGTSAAGASTHGLDENSTAYDAGNSSAYGAGGSSSYGAGGSTFYDDSTASSTHGTLGTSSFGRHAAEVGSLGAVGAAAVGSIAAHSAFQRNPTEIANLAMSEPATTIEPTGDHSTGPISSTPAVGSGTRYASEDYYGTRSSSGLGSASLTGVAIDSTRSALDSSSRAEVSGRGSSSRAEVSGPGSSSRTKAASETGYPSVEEPPMEIDPTNKSSALSQPKSSSEAKTSSSGVIPSYDGSSNTGTSSKVSAIPDEIKPSATEGRDSGLNAYGSTLPQSIATGPAQVSSQSPLAVPDNRILGTTSGLGSSSTGPSTTTGLGTSAIGSGAAGYTSGATSSTLPSRSATVGASSPVMGSAAETALPSIGAVSGKTSTTGAGASSGSTLLAPGTPSQARPESRDVSPMSGARAGMGSAASPAAGVQQAVGRSAAPSTPVKTTQASQSGTPASASSSSRTGGAGTGASTTPQSMAERKGKKKRTSLFGKLKEKLSGHNK